LLGQTKGDVQVKPFNKIAPLSVAALAALALTLGACGQSDETQAGDRLDGAAAPTYPGEGAEGLVEIEKAPINEAPEQTVSTGQNQTPAYGEPAGAPSEVHSGPVTPAAESGSRVR
jgi:hypothetical protein